MYRRPRCFSTQSDHKREAPAKSGPQAEPTLLRKWSFRSPLCSDGVQKELEVYIYAMLVEESPAVLSLGRLSGDIRYSYSWNPVEHPQLRNSGVVIQVCSENCARAVAATQQTGTPAQEEVRTLMMRAAILCWSGCNLSRKAWLKAVQSQRVVT